MLYDRYAFRQTQLNNHLNQLEQAKAEFEQARKQRDTNSRQQAEAAMRQAANGAAKIEPHLAYLWYEARDSELDNSIRDAWQQRLAVINLLQAQKEHFDFCKIPEIFRFTPNVSDAARLPLFGFLLHIPFRLQTPYLSKDERDFYLLDNPLRREKIFQTPMIAATGWKGALRTALWQLSYDEDHEVIQRLFGNPRGSEDGQAGRLHFYPTFFNQIDKVKLEVINPHDRETGVGARGPILMECVPRGATGELVLLYVPFGSIDSNGNDTETEVALDLAILVEGIQAMLTIYGFGAKTSSGFGLAEDRLANKGILALRGELPGLAVVAASEPEPATPALPRYLESPTRLHPDFRQPDDSLKTESEYETFIKSRGGQYSKKDKQLYEKAQKWWEREGRQSAEASLREPAETPLPAHPPPAITELPFSSLSELRDIVKGVVR